MKVVVIIPAAGLGTRMAPVTSKGKSPSKQFTELGGTPILIHTIRKFAASPKINEIVVALRKDEMPGVQERLRSDNARRGKKRDGRRRRTLPALSGKRACHGLSFHRRCRPRS
jgi:2-C-methyl-D-erythritol 4-phosphate cytidylyltransferase